jgi:hypothetical protein
MRQRRHRRWTPERSRRELLAGWGVATPVTRLQRFLAWASKGGATPLARPGVAQFQVTTADIPLHTPVELRNRHGGNRPRWLRDVDGRTRIATLARRWGMTPSQARAEVQELLGRGLSVLAMQHLAEVVDPFEVVRYPVPGASLDRNYWQNFADARQAIAADGGACLASTEAFAAFLQRLHLLQLMGADLDSFYVSPRNAQVPTPGLFRRETYRFEHPLFTSYVRALAVRGGAPLPEEGQTTSGRFRWGCYRGATYFYTVEVGLEALEHVRRCLVVTRTAQRTGDVPRLIGALARFHQRMARLHPFPTANNVIAMNLVNHVLREVTGAFLPHLILDLIATVADEDTYALVFARAVREFAVPVKASASARRSVSSRARTFERLMSQAVTTEAFRPPARHEALLLFT